MRLVEYLGQDAVLAFVESHAQVEVEAVLARAAVKNELLIDPQNNIIIASYVHKHVRIAVYLYAGISICHCVL
jgi:hypothetical protein